MSLDITFPEEKFLSYTLEVELLERDDHWVVRCEQLRCFDYGDTAAEAVENLKQGASLLFSHYTSRDELEKFLKSSKISYCFSEVESRKMVSGMHYIEDSKSNNKE